MDDPQRAGGQEEGGEDNSKAISQPYISNTDSRKYSNTSATPNSKSEKIKDYLKHLLAEKPDRHIELLLTLVIAFFAATQLLITCSNNSSTSAQSERLLDSANRIDDAAESFSKSSADISRGMTSAVNELDTQAKTAEAARRTSESASQKTLNASISIARRDQRAWLGVGDYKYSLNESSPLETTTIAVNTGKSPATNVLCKSSGATKPKGYVLRDSDIIYPPELPLVKQGTIFPGQHFTLKTSSAPMDPGTQKSWFAHVQDTTWTQYFWGEIIYKDAFGVKHWTHFCTEYLPATKDGRPCSIYNDTDETKN